MKHPAIFFIRYLILKNPTHTDAQILKVLEDWGFLSPLTSDLQEFRQLPTPPPNFDFSNRTHRPSMKYLRDLQVYELFFPTPAVEEAWNILSDPDKRLAVEQILLGRLDPKLSAQKLNQNRKWLLTADGITAFGHFFWNVKLLTFDEWGKFLYGRAAMYEKFMCLLQAPPNLAFYHLRLTQAIESKEIIQRAQEIAYFTLEELAQKPGSGADKVKGISVLARACVECHNALSTSDMALKDVLKQFEKFRIELPQNHPTDINKLSPAGSYTNSGAQEELPVPVKIKDEEMN